MSSKNSSTRQSKTPLNHLKSKKWCFPPSPLRQSSGGSGSGSTPLLSPSKSPEPNCAICLGKIEDKSFTDRCFHCFCRLCLFEWAKVKAECPVCRQAFEKIIFNIRAMDDYDEHVVQNAHRHRFGPFVAHPNFGYGTPFVNLDGNTRFRYPTTLTPLRRRMMDFERRIQMQLMTDYPHNLNFPHFMDFLDNNRRSREQRSSRSGGSIGAINNNNILRNSSSNPLDSRSSRSATQTLPFSDRHRLRAEDPMLSGHTSNEWNPRFYANPFDVDIFPPPVGTSAHRRYIYDSELYVLTNGDGNTQRTREVSARFFSSNPACTHRLIPWLNRELNAILDNTSETETLIPRIMNALLMYDITSVGFKKIIAPFTLTKTDHFIHEFYNFARSPHDMDQYTRISVYVPRHRAEVIRSDPLPAPVGYQMESNSPNGSPDSVSSSSSSIEILDEQLTRRCPRTPNRIQTLSPTLSLRVYSIDGSDSDESSTEIRQLITPSPVNTPSNPSSEAVANNDVSSTSNPTPLPRGDLPDVNFGNIDIIDDFENPKPGTSGLSRMRSLAQTKWSDSETTDVDVGQELEAAIARFENGNNVRTEVKIENIETKPKENVANDSDSSCSSVLIVGYVKPLHERTPEFVDLISSEEENNNQNEKQIKSKKSKKDKKSKHRKRLNGRSRSRSPDSHSKHKRKCKHKSRDRFRDKSRDSYHRHHKHRSHRHSKSYRSSSTSSSSSSSSNYDELRQLNKSFKTREQTHRTHPKVQSESRDIRQDSGHQNNQTTDPSNSPSTDKLVLVSTTTSTTSSRPSSLSSVVIRKEPTANQSFKFRPYLIYSDSD